MSRQLNITDFRYGLDSRRSELTSRSGVLLKCNNGYVTQGAEIFKRKAFVKTQLPVGTFGLLATATGLLTFGSLALGSLPAPGINPPFQYQQLTSPLGSAMTAFVGATLFNGEAFIIATFGTDGTFCFYNGVLVPDFTSGFVLTGLTTNTEQATELAALINNNPTVSNNYSATSALGVVTIFGKTGSNYTLDDAIVSAAGIITNQVENVAQSSNAGVQAIAQFTVVAGQATLTNSGATITLATGFIDVDGIALGPLVFLVTHKVNWTGDSSSFALALVLEINSNTATTGYYATSDLNIVSIFEVTPDASKNNAVLQIESTRVCVASCPINIVGTAFTLGNAGVTAALVDTTTGSSITPPANAYQLGGGGFTTLSDLLISMANDINTYASGIGPVNRYQAVTDGATLWVNRVLESSANGGTYQISTDVAVLVQSGTAVISGGSTFTTSFQAIIPGALLGGLAGRTALITPAISCNVVGGIGPFTFLWIINSLNSTGSSIYPQSPGSVTTSFGAPIPEFSNPLPQASVTCQVTDSTGKFVRSNSCLVGFQ